MNQMKTQKGEPDTPASLIHAVLFQQAGQAHIQMRTGCEDVSLIVERTGFLFYGLADGQSGQRFGAMGGRACLEMLADYIQQQGVEWIINYPFPDELPCIIMQQIRTCIQAIVQEHGGVFSDYASTLLFVAVNPVSGKYVTVHLGDGNIIGISNEGKLALISSPENGITPQYTWLTTSQYAVPHLRIGSGSIASFKRILLLTDGVNKLCNGRNISTYAKSLMADGTQDNILEYLNHSHPYDDSSCIIMDCRANEIKA